MVYIVDVQPPLVFSYFHSSDISGKLKIENLYIIID